MHERFYRTLPSQTAELSRLLTGARGERSLSYLSRPNFLSAYLHYFLPWNLCRLCRLLANIEVSLKAGDIITDIGSGPLTFVLALWITRNDLREVPLEFYCIDRSLPALEAGKKLLAAFCDEFNKNADNGGLWKIHIVKEDIDIRKKTDNAQKRKKASLVCAVNVFNEIYETLPHNNREGLRRMAEKIANYMHGQALADACILTVEPGVPQSGRFIAFLRSAFLELGREPLSPCTHTKACPLNGEKKRWCHFAFEAADAPKELLRLSAAAGLPKERLVFSYLLAGAAISAPAKNAPKKSAEKVRVISDAFPLPPARFGRYGCCSRGLVLLRGGKNRVEKTACGSLAAPIFAANEQRDAKSGALIMELP